MRQHGPMTADASGLLPTDPAPTRVRLRLRRVVPALLIAIAAFVVGTPLGGIFGTTTSFNLFGWRFAVPRGWVVVIVVALVLVFIVAGINATRGVGRELDRVSAVKAGIAVGAAIRLICSIVGYVTVGLGVLAMLQVNLGNLLVGGAVTGVVIGIAAQQTLGNFFAGLVLLFARPYVPGTRVKIRTGALGGPFEGVITVTGLLYTTIETDCRGADQLAQLGPARRGHRPGPRRATATGRSAHHVIRLHIQRELSSGTIPSGDQMA